MTVCNPNPIDLQGVLDGPPSPLNDDQVSTTAKLLVDCRCHLGEVSSHNPLQQNLLVYRNFATLDFFLIFLSSLLRCPSNLFSVLYMMIDRMQSSLQAF
jgi:hypothetical protein